MFGYILCTQVYTQYTIGYTFKRARSRYMEDPTKLIERYKARILICTLDNICTYKTDGRSSRGGWMDGNKDLRAHKLYIIIRAYIDFETILPGHRRRHLGAIIYTSNRVITNAQAATRTLCSIVRICVYICKTNELREYNTYNNLIRVNCKHL